jgi:hypothetical protein
MIEHIPTLSKISAIALGSGWGMIAQTATGNAQDVHVYGGWGLAVVGLFTLWREFKEERKKRDQLTELYHEKSVERDKESAKRDEAFIEAMGNTSRSIKSMEDKFIKEMLTFREAQPK